MSNQFLDITGLSYEEALAALETVVADLENSAQTLDESVYLFERGQALARHCTTLLEQAELKVQLLTMTTEGVTLSTFDPDQT